MPSPIEQVLSAVRTGRAGDVSTLLREHPGLATISQDGLPLLHIAILRDGSKELVSALVSGGCEIDGRDGNGKTALHHAVQLERSELVHHLVEHGARSEALDNAGRPAFPKWCARADTSARQTNACVDRR